MLRKVIAIIVSTIIVAATTIQDEVNFTHIPLEVHIDKDATKKTISIVDSKKDSVELLGYEIEVHDRFTAKEKEILCRIAEAEAEDGNILQKKNVMSCVLNRVISKDFPNSIEAVVFEKNQFTPVWDGRYYSVTIQQSTYEAYEEWLIDIEKGCTHDYLFFCTPYASEHSKFFKNKEWLYEDGMHRYFVERE